MKERERFLDLMAGGSVDRPPLLEEGVREEVIDAWRTQGLPRDMTHLELFGLTPHENVGPNLRYDDSYFGKVVGLSDREYRSAFNVSRSRFPEDWSNTVRRLRSRDHIVCIWASRGFFQALGVGDWPTLEQALIAAVKRPELIRTRLEMYGEFCARMLELTMDEIEPEFLYLSEPISDTDAPLISPDMFEEFMIPADERIIAVARSFGCDNILVSTYGNSTRVFPALIRTGVNMLWISEAAEVPELDYRKLRRSLGPHVGLIGGIPLSILRRAPSEDVQKSLEEIVSPLLTSGRYVPLAGGRVREEIPWVTYKRYRESLAALLNQ